ncbi:hypothetical protein T4B_6407 [Trichinella pseudospiralis]|uniref:Uncharacterized protein n=1 Tax=Trichinella pseudospiralis TaxID=6337 RepID=A0A0V1IQZ4_TRIPS|nr:hypothetical protein T4A_13224 [Trichinella pseudospiralis]KRY68145.1 hypothetical protein T4A_2101 [Trichinella pseudospiralis]KRZ25069.1 hypothetical protein T4B_6407 [Trichinella pseudospiralis]
MNFKALSAHEEETYSSLLCYPSSDKNAASLSLIFFFTDQPVHLENIKIPMANSHGKLIFLLFVVWNVTFVTSSMNQTNETDAGVAKYFDKIKGHKRTVNAKWMNMNEIVDGQQIKKEIKDLRRAIHNLRLKTELRKKPSEREELFQKKWNTKIISGMLAINMLICMIVMCSLKNHIKYVKTLKYKNRRFRKRENHNRRINYAHPMRKPMIKPSRKLQLQ